MAPDHLAVYLSDRCNLSCSYCYVSVNEGPAAKLDFPALKKAVDDFLAFPGPSKKITFLGGEPLLDWRAFTEIALYARRAGGRGVILQTFSNGTLLTPEKLAFLDEQDVHLTISLDGRKGSNDKHRVYFQAKERSVFEDVMARLEGAPKERLGVSLVFTADTVGDFLGNVDYFQRQGFGRITFNPELYESWPEAKLEVLRTVMKGFARYYKAILANGRRPFAIPILYSVIENMEKNRKGLRWWHDCHNVVLGPDGSYYACDKPLAFKPGTATAHRAGTALRGLDWERRADLLKEAAAEVEARGYGEGEHFCPIGVQAFAKQAGRDPGPLLMDFHKVADVFAGGLAAMVEDLKDDPRFQEIYYGAHVV